MALQTFEHLKKVEDTKQAELAAKKAEYMREAAILELVRYLFLFFPFIFVGHNALDELPLVFIQTVGNVGSNIYTIAEEISFSGIQFHEGAVLVYVTASSVFPFYFCLDKTKQINHSCDLVLFN
jgi:hypothetical protein